MPQTWCNCPGSVFFGNREKPKKRRKTKARPSEKAFVEKKGICYIPEHAFSDYDGKSLECDECEVDEEKFDDSFTYQDFYDLAKKFVEENEVSTEHSIETIAQNLFDMVDWQYPSTLINDWEISGAYED